MTAAPATTAPASTVGALRRTVAAKLRTGWGMRDGLDRPDIDARLLVAHALGADAANLALRDEEVVLPDVVASAEGYTRRRLRGEPVARIVGEKEFWGLSFRLSPGTMVPRPDTETLVETALERIDAAGRRNGPLRVLDLGTGTGCILLAILSELPNATGLGVDRDAGAVATATENAERLGMGGRVRFVAGDWAQGIEGPFDVISANPPYVEDEALPALPVEVIGFDPRLALSGGPDGLASYRIIIPELPRLLASDGFAVMEYGPRQAKPIVAVAEASGFTAEIRLDLAGRERAVLLARR